MRFLFTALFLMVLASLAVVPKPGHLTMVSALMTIVMLGAVLWQFLTSLRSRLRMPRYADGGSGRDFERATAAREGERSRLRGDLHDSLGPALAGIRLRLDVAADRVAQPSARQLILDAADETSRTVDDLRRIIDDLRPADLESGGLPDALWRLVRRIPPEASPEISIDLPAAGSTAGFSAATELAAYRIASEALTNVLRHANACTAMLRLTLEGDWLVLEVADDGNGPPGADVRISGRGVGLASMEARARDVGGYCEVLPTEGATTGTLVRAVLPRVVR